MIGNLAKDCRSKGSAKASFDGTCNYCSKKGHKAVDCKKKQADKKSGKISGVDEGESPSMESADVGSLNIGASTASLKSSPATRSTTSTVSQHAT